MMLEEGYLDSDLGDPEQTRTRLVLSFAACLVSAREPTTVSCLPAWILAPRSAPYTMAHVVLVSCPSLRRGAGTLEVRVRVKFATVQHHDHGEQ